MGAHAHPAQQSDFPRFPRQVVLRVDEQGLALLQFGGLNDAGKETNPEEQRRVLAQFSFAQDILSWQSSASSFDFVSVPLKRSLSFKTLRVSPSGAFSTQCDTVQGVEVMRFVQTSAQRAFQRMMGDQL